MARVRIELGDDAVILSTKTLPGSIMEVSAGIENHAGAGAPFLSGQGGVAAPALRRTREREYAAAIENQVEDPVDSRIRPAVFPRIVTKRKSSPGAAAENRALQKSPRIADIDRRLIELEKRIGGAAEPGSKDDSAGEARSLPLGGDPELLRWMREREIDPSWYQASGVETPRDAPIEIKTAVFRRALAGKLRTAPVLKGPGRDGPLKMALVGPTGSGKTTTIAKIASWLTIRKRKKVALLSLDTFRIGAARQLETYAEILQVPFSVVRDSESIRFALGSFGNRDVILIDTTGRSPGRAEEIEQLSRMLKAVRTDEIHITIPATHSYRYLRAAWLSYRKTGGDRLIVTKLDEAPVCGSLLDLVKEFNPLFSFQTFGQMVPDDFRPADPGRIVNRIFGAGANVGSGTAVTQTN